MTNLTGLVALYKGDFGQTCTGGRSGQDAGKRLIQAEEDHRPSANPRGWGWAGQILPHHPQGDRPCLRPASRAVTEPTSTWHSVTAAMESRYSVGSPVAGSFHSASRLRGSSTLQPVWLFHPCSWLNDSPSYSCATVCFSFTWRGMFGSFLLWG